MAYRVILPALVLAVLPALAGPTNPLASCATGVIGCAPRGVWTGTFRGKPLTCCVVDHRCDAHLPNPLPLEGQCRLGQHQRRHLLLDASGQGFLCHATKRGKRRGPCCAFVAPSSSGGAFVAQAECRHVLNVPLSLAPQ